MQKGPLDVVTVMPPQTERDTDGKGSEALPSELNFSSGAAVSGATDEQGSGSRVTVLSVPQGERSLSFFSRVDIYIICLWFI
jgi:hypothetical protein